MSGTSSEERLDSVALRISALDKILAEMAKAEIDTPATLAASLEEVVRVLRAEIASGNAFQI